MHTTCRVLLGLTAFVLATEAAKGRLWLLSADRGDRRCCQLIWQWSTVAWCRVVDAAFPILTAFRTGREPHSALTGTVSNFDAVKSASRTW
jgi:hypothetical protein